MENEKEKLDVRFPRTLESTLFEIFTAALLVVIWVKIFLVVKAAGGRPVATHFDMMGRADDYDSPYAIIVVGVVFTAVVALQFFGAYRPSEWIRTVTPLRNMRQMALVSRCTRIVGVELALLFLTMVESDSGYLVAAFYVILVAIVLTALIMEIMLRRMR